MYIAENETCSTTILFKAIALFALSAVWLSAGGCGRTNVKNFFDDEEQNGGNRPSPIDAGFDRNVPIEATGGSGSIFIQPSRDVGVTYDAGWDFDAKQNGDGSNGLPLICEQNADCVSFNKCEIPVCTVSGICSNLPLEDGMPCYNAIGNQLCLNGICQNSLCGDGYLDENAGEVCDDGNYSNSDDCVNCNEAICGDGFLHQDDEECEPDLDSYCKDDCTLGSCGDDIVTSPAENCEPSIDGSACNEFCRLSDEPEWKIEISSIDLSPDLTQMGIALLLDSAGQPIVVSSDSYVDDDNMSRDIVIVTKYDGDGEQLWQWVSNEEEIPFSPSNDNNDSIRALNCMGASIDLNDHVVLSGMITTEDLAVEQRPWLSKIDQNGQLLWSTTLDSDECAFPSVATDDQDNIMVLMFSMAELTSVVGTVLPYWSVKDPSIELFTSDGTHRPDDSVAITGYFAFRSALSSGTVGDSSSFILSGLRENASGYSAFMALLDSNGEMIWNSPINYADESEEIGFLRALAASDGDIVVLGKAVMELYAFPYSFWFERYGPEKTPRYEERKEIRIYPEPTEPLPNILNFSSVYLPMAVDGGNNLFFTYSILKQFERRANLNIDKYDSDGEPVWERPLIYDTGLEEAHLPVEIKVSDQGSIYVLDILVTVDSDGPITSLSLLVWSDPDYTD